jgi:site-specific recombinase XerD
MIINDVLRRSHLVIGKEFLSTTTRCAIQRSTTRLRNGASTHDVPEFAGHADIRTTESYSVANDEQAEVAARRANQRRRGGSRNSV